MYATTLTFPLESVLQAAGDGYRLMLAPVNVPSDDGRVIVNQLGARPGRLPLYFSDSEAGHDDAIHVGTFEDVTAEMIDGQVWMVSDNIVWDTDAEAVEARRMVDEGQARGVSIHMGKGDFGPVCPDGSGGFFRIEDDDLSFDEETGAVTLPCESPLMGAFDAEIAAVTIVGIPAFPGAKIEPDEVVGNMLVASFGETLAESATGLPPGNYYFTTDLGGVSEWSYTPALGEVEGRDLTMRLDDVDLNRPPAEWFANPNFGTDGHTDPRLSYDKKYDQWGCPWTVTEEGQCFGHVALWKTCHTAVDHTCLTPPRNADFDRFHSAARVTADNGEVIPTGVWIVDEPHHPTQWGTSKMMDHLSNTENAAGYLVAGTDEHGIWVAGAIAPNLPADKLERLRRHAGSGDWRAEALSSVGKDGYELFAVVAVNAPGYPIPQARIAAAAEDEGFTIWTSSLVASADTPRTDLELVAEALTALASEVASIRAAVIHESGDVTVETEDGEPVASTTEADEAAADFLASEFLADEVD